MLEEANQRWHLYLDEQYQAFLENLTELDLGAARRLWSQFRKSLLRHIEFEQKHIEPLALDWSDNTLKLIQADHLILSRLLPRLETAIERIEDAEIARGELVRQLDTFIKLRNVLEHHDLREKEHLYPVLEQSLEAQHCAQLAAEMDRHRIKLE